MTWERRRRFRLGAAIGTALVISAFWMVAASAQTVEPLGGGLDSLLPGADDSQVEVRAEFTAPGDGKPAHLFVTAQLKPGWHIYSITQSKGGPIRTKIEPAPSKDFTLDGKFRPTVEPKREKSEAFKGIIVETHEGEVTWYVPIRWADGVDPRSLSIEGNLTVQPCTAKSCMPPQSLPFTAKLGKGIDVTTLPPPTTQAAEGTQEDAAGSVDPNLAGQDRSLVEYLFFGFIGGIILNLMPCVLPVIGLKLFSFVEQAGHDRRTALLLNLWYSFGLLAVFWVLAALAVLLNLGWGMLFQSAGFNVFLAAFIFAMALSFLGVWEFPIPGIVGRGDLGRKEGFIGAFAKGVITTVLATPCTGPFMGTALAWALRQPGIYVFAVFTSVGLGMALPYLLIGAFPRLIRFLPKPGEWMETFKQVLGFVLMGTIVYIFTFLWASYVVPTVGLLFAVWFGCWWAGRKAAAGAAPLAGWLEAAAIVGVAWIMLFFGVDRLVPKAVGDKLWRGFPSLQSIMESRVGNGQPKVRATFDRLIEEKKTVLVDFTADWCATCKVLEATVLNSEEVQAAMEEKKVAFLKADWTHRNPEVTEMLRRLRAQQVPVIAIYPAGRPDKPIVLLDAYTKASLLKALEQAVPSQ